MKTPLIVLKTPYAPKHNRHATHTNDTIYTSDNVINKNKCMSSVVKTNSNIARYTAEYITG